ncbi:MAG: hypothetical protein WEE64_14965 [Dehalococcoidia bacterium]
MRSLRIFATGMVLLSGAAGVFAAAQWLEEARAVSPQQVNQGLTIEEPSDGADVEAQQVTIRGSAPAGAEIGRKVKGTDPKFYSGQDGRWEYTAKLKEGENSFDFSLQEDKDTKAKLTVNWRPTLTVDEPSAGSTITTQGIIVRGTAPAGAEIGLSADEKDPKFYAGDDGRWEYPIKVTEEGDNTFKFFLQEAKGAKVELIVIWQPVLEVDEALDGATVNTQYLAIRGSAARGAEIGRNVKGTDPKFFAGQDGRWVYTAKLKEGENAFDFFLQGAKGTRVKFAVVYAPEGVTEPTGAASPTPAGEPPKPTATPEPPEGLSREEVAYRLAVVNGTCFANDAEQALGDGVGGCDSAVEFRGLLRRLEPKCNADSPERVADMVVRAQQIIRDNGYPPVSLLEVMHALDDSIPVGLPPQDCTGVLAAWITLAYP